MTRYILEPKSADSSGEDDSDEEETGGNVEVWSICFNCRLQNLHIKKGPQKQIGIKHMFL